MGGSGVSVWVCLVEMFGCVRCMCVGVFGGNVRVCLVYVCGCVWGKCVGVSGVCLWVCLVEACGCVWGTFVGVSGGSVYVCLVHVCKCISWKCVGVSVAVWVCLLQWGSVFVEGGEWTELPGGPFTPCPLLPTPFSLLQSPNSFRPSCAKH